MKLSEIPHILPHHIEKDGSFEKFGLSSLNYSEEDMVLGYLESIDYLNSMLKSKSFSSIVCTSSIASTLMCKGFEGGICIAEEPKGFFFELHNYLKDNTSFFGKDKETFIDSSATIDPAAVIDKRNVHIGKNVRIGANSVIHANTVIGNNVTIKENCIVGTEAFYYFNYENRRKIVVSTGKTFIEDWVDLHPGTVVCNGVLGLDTVIGEDSKIDSNCFIGHNSIIGKQCTLAAGTKLGGWARIGDRTFCGVNTSVAPMVNVSNDCKTSIGSVITKDVPEGVQVSGNFAIAHEKFISFIKTLV